MWNCIRMEMYKIFRMKSFWWISLITIGLVFATTQFTCEDLQLEQETEQTAVSSESDGNLSVVDRDDETVVNFGITEDTSGLEMQSVEVLGMFEMHLESGLLTMMLVIFAVIYATADTKCGYIKNIGGQVRHRRYLVFVKWIAMAAYIIVFDVICLAVQCIAEYWSFHYLKLGSLTEYLPSIMLEVALQYAFLIVCMTIAIIIRSRAFSMTLSLCLIMGLDSMACAGISAAIHYLLHKSVDLAPYLLTTKMQNMEISVSMRDVQSICILVVVYLAVTAVLGIWKMEKRDLV